MTTTIEPSAKQSIILTALKEAGIVDSAKESILVQALELYRTKLELNLTICIEHKKSQLLTMFYQKRINQTTELIKSIN